MTLEITEQERTILLELIESEEREAIQGLDHADTRAFKDLLRGRLKILESVKDKILTDTGVQPTSNE
jgi:hypothetical protein